MRKSYAEVQTLRQLPTDQETRLQQLKTQLLNLPKTALDYTDLLRDIELHRVAIETNSKNYIAFLENLQAIALPEDNLEIWQKNSTDSISLFIEQIATDLAYLQPSQSLFQQAIDTICGTVEIEQAEIDRASVEAIKKHQNKLESLIFTVSTGLAISGISSQVIGEPTRILRNQNTKTFQTQSISTYFIYGTFDVLFHLIIGIIPATIVGFILYEIKKW